MGFTRRPASTPPVEAKHPDLDLIRDSFSAMFQLHTESSEGPRLRKRKLRSSSLPYCGLLELYNHTRDDGEGGEDWNVESEYYTGVGKILHQIIQDALPRSLKKLELIGRFDGKLAECDRKKCPNIGPRGLTAHSKKGCPKCGKHPPYIETDLEREYTSHLDLVFRVKGTNRVWIVDIKTTSVQTLWFYSQGRSEIITKGYGWQLDSYAISLKDLMDKMGWVIEGTAFMFVPRDTPRKFKVVPYRVGIDDHWFKRREAQLKRMAENYIDVGTAMGQGSNSKHGTPITLEDFRTAYSKKPCSSRQHYETEIASKYDPCPLMERCVGSDQASLGKHLTKIVKNQQLQEA